MNGHAQQPNVPYDTAKFSVRELRPKDSDGLWRIRNLDEVRLLSNNTAVIPKADHDAWFAKYIANPDNRCYVLEYGGDVAGYCRIDSGLVSIAIDPKYHGLGLGKKLLKGSVDLEIPTLKKITAEIRLNNDVSLKLFTKVGFKVVDQTPEKYILEYHGS